MPIPVMGSKQPTKLRVKWVGPRLPHVSLTAFLARPQGLWGISFFLRIRPHDDMQGPVRVGPPREEVWFASPLFDTRLSTQHQWRRAHQVPRFRTPGSTAEGAGGRIEILYMPAFGSTGCARPRHSKFHRYLLTVGGDRRREKMMSNALSGDRTRPRGCPRQQAREAN